MIDKWSPPPPPLLRNHLPSGRDDTQLRMLALEHAVATHGDTIDEDQVVAAAEEYLRFLKNDRQTGEKPEA